MNPQLIIPVAKKNINILNKNIKYINKYIHPKQIFIITQKENFKLLNTKSPNIKLVDEDNVIPNYNFTKFQNLICQTSIPIEKTGWYFQQLIKLLWSKSNYCDDYYVTWDADTFPIRKIILFSNNNKPYFHKKVEYHKPYFDTINILLGLTKEVDFSFISEKMVFSKQIVNELLDKILCSNVRGNNIIEKILYTSGKSDDYRAFSEFETYGTFVTHFYPNFYEFQNLKSFRNGARYFGLKPNIFDLSFISIFYSTVSFEQWDKPKKILLPFLKVFSFLTFPICKLITCIQSNFNS